MAKEALEHLMNSLRAEAPVRQLDAETGHAWLRHLIEPGTHWAFMVDIEQPEQREFVQSLGRADRLFTQPVTLTDPDTGRPVTVRLLVLALYSKSRLSRE